VFDASGFVHVSINFATINSQSVLLIIGNTCSVDWSLFEFLLGVFPMKGSKTTEHVAWAVTEKVSIAIPSKLVIVSTMNVDGALQSVGEAIVGEEDTFWCFTHQAYGCWSNCSCMP
jgi:hypothetical protein